MNANIDDKMTNVSIDTLNLFAQELDAIKVLLSQMVQEFMKKDLEVPPKVQEWFLRQQDNGTSLVSQVKAEIAHYHQMKQIKRAYEGTYQQTK